MNSFERCQRELKQLKGVQRGLEKLREQRNTENIDVALELRWGGLLNPLKGLISLSAQRTINLEVLKRLLRLNNQERWNQKNPMTLSMGGKDKASH